MYSYTLVEFLTSNVSNVFIERFLFSSTNISWLYEEIIKIRSNTRSNIDDYRNLLETEISIVRRGFHPVSNIINKKAGRKKFVTFQHLWMASLCSIIVKLAKRKLIMSFRISRSSKLSLFVKHRNWSISVSAGN